jgi:hypothetical protein
LDPRFPRSRSPEVIESAVGLGSFVVTTAPDEEFVAIKK